MYKTFILDIQFDNGVDVQRKTAVCIAPDRATATRLVKQTMEKSVDDTVTVLSAREMMPGDVVVID